MISSKEARQKTLLHDNGWDPGQSPLAQSPTPFEDDSDDSPAPTVIANTDKLSEALSVASATDAHGSLIKEPQVRKRGKLSEALSAYRLVHRKEVNEAWLNMTVCCRGQGGIGLRKMTTSVEISRQTNTGHCNWPDNRKRHPLPREDEQRDHISSSSQDEPATGKLLPASEGARGEPVHKRVKMQARGHDPNCCGNPTWDRGLQGSLGSTEVRGRTRSM